MNIDITFCTVCLYMYRLHNINLSIMEWVDDTWFYIFRAKVRMSPRGPRNPVRRTVNQILRQTIVISQAIQIVCSRINLPQAKF